MHIPLYIVDAFTTRRFSGNPAAVCFPAEPVPGALMQAIAGEVNLSETAFLQAASGSGTDFDLRWFTPQAEVALCGHATLAAVHVLHETGRLATGATLSFRTQSGLLGARIDGEGWIELDFPALPPERIPPPDGLAQALGCEPSYTGKSSYDLLATVADETVLRTLTPDYRRLAALPARGVIVTAPATDPRFDFVSRFFAPAIGVDEDPVTGSAHCVLAPYWGRLLGKTTLEAWQASARGGHVRLRLDGARVRLLGRAVTVIRGEIPDPGEPPLPGDDPV